MPHALHIRELRLPTLPRQPPLHIDPLEEGRVLFAMPKLLTHTDARESLLHVALCERLLPPTPLVGVGSSAPPAGAELDDLFNPRPERLACVAGASTRRAEQHHLTRHHIAQDVRHPRLHARLQRQQVIADC